jgi:signal transduction histidine kinase
MSLTKPIARPDADPFPGDGEMAVLLRSVDWAATPIGSPEGWPQSLRTSLSICLLSRFPIVLWWGPDLVLLYNDAYRQIIADKHPRAMGMAAREVWPEIWDVIGPMLDGVMTRGEATWSEDQLLFLNRHGFAEECYFTFSYSPIIDESGGVGGVFCAVTETTGQVLRERRLALLRELPVGGPDATAASKAFLDVLRRDVHDLPYAWFIPARDDPPKALAAIDRPTQVLLGAPGSDGDEGARYSLGLQPLPQDPWGAPVERALALPVERPGTDSRWGVLVLGLAPRLALDAEYEDLLRLVAAALGTTMASADALAAERERAEMLAELDRAKTTFFTNISHEFRTPLTLLLGPLDDLAAADLSSRDAERVEMARRNARRLYRLVNALLEFSRIEAGRTQASFEPVDLPTLSRQMASMFRSAFDTAGVGMVIDAEPLPTPVYVDREMWERIVLNLVSNAFKHTHEGEVRVEIRPDGTEAVLVVTDTGVGIAPDELPRVFERFHRVDNPGARTHEGSGIGLALVQELVRLHGGRIHVTSEVGRGRCACRSAWRICRRTRFARRRRAAATRRSRARSSTRR